MLKSSKHPAISFVSMLTLLLVLDKIVETFDNIPWVYSYYASKRHCYTSSLEFEAIPGWKYRNRMVGDVFCELFFFVSQSCNSLFVYILSGRGLVYLTC